jgi:hypothetical protein
MPVLVRDGATLRVNVFRPSSGQPVPVIMSAHPYGKDRIPARTRSGRGLNVQYRIIPQPQPVEFSEWTSWEAPDPAVSPRVLPYVYKRGTSRIIRQDGAR